MIKSFDEKRQNTDEHFYSTMTFHKVGQKLLMSFYVTF